MRAITREQFLLARRNFPFFKDVCKPTVEELRIFFSLQFSCRYKWCVHVESNVCLESVCPNYSQCTLCQIITLCRISDPINAYCGPRYMLYENVLHDLHDVHSCTKNLSTFQKEIQYPHWDCEICKLCIKGKDFDC